jgi:hypothetical protein
MVVVRLNEARNSANDVYQIRIQAEERWATSRRRTAMRFWDVVDRNTAILMVEAVSHNVAQIPAIEERESRSTFSLLAVFFSLSSNLRFFSLSLTNSMNPELQKHGLLI